ENIQKSRVLQQVPGRQRNRAGWKKVQETPLRSPIREVRRTVSIPRDGPKARRQRNRPESIRQVSLFHDDVGDTGPTGRVEQSVEKRPPKVEINENDTPTGTRERDSKIGDRRRLPLLLDGRGDHDRLGRGRGIDELETRPQLPEGFGFDACGVLEHHEVGFLLQLARGLWSTPEQRKLKRPFELVLSSNMSIERFRQ